ncbi:unnamed protein product [Ectocarpus sp. 6 AP-2014]
MREYDIQTNQVIYLVSRLSGGKQVIVLYPSAPLDANVTLKLSPPWSFSALYPRPLTKKQRQTSGYEAIVASGQHCEWIVHANPDGSLTDFSTSREYPYLFWEADSTDGLVCGSFGLEETPSFCVAGNDAGLFLDGALERLGLNVREGCDMITYWLPQLEP